MPRKTKLTPNTCDDDLSALLAPELSAINCEHSVLVRDLKEEEKYYPECVYMCKKCKNKFIFSGLCLI